MCPDETIWELELHTKAKHAILDKYLKGWFPKLSRYNGRILYIDGFAGPGLYKGGELGSPIIAINLCREHIIQMESEIIFLFIEADEDRCSHLQTMISELDIPKNFKVATYCNKFDEKLTELLDIVNEQGKGFAPSFIFVDPFGYSQTPFSIINRILQNNKSEVLITFVYDYINRFINESDRAPLFDELFGTDKWRDVCSITEPAQRKAFIHNLYVKQLKTVAGVKYVRSFEMVNKHGHTEYFLIFCTNHIEGLKLMKYAMWSIDDSGGYTFSDRTDPLQTVLFERDPNYSQLKKLILERFKGKTISVEELERFIVEETAFRETHFKRPILIPMETADPPEIEVTNRRNVRTYPPRCKIKLL